MTVRFLTICFLFCTICTWALGQSNDSAQLAPDTTPLNFVQRLQRFGKEETVKSRETVAANKAASTQRFLLNEIRKTVLEAKLYLQKGLDTTAIAREVDEARRDMQTAREGILTDPGPFQTLRDLKVSAIILSQLLLHMEQQRRQLDNYTNQLMKYRETIDSLTGHDELLAFPNDSVALVKYLTKIVVIGKDASPVDSGIKQSLFSVQDLQTKVDLIEYELNANIEQVNNLRRSLASTTFDRELPAQRTSFSRVFAFSWKKDKLALRHYLAYNYMWILLLLLGIFTSWRFLTTLRARVSDKEANELVVRRPLLSAIIIITSLFQFFLPDPPFLVNLLFWAVPAICLIFVFAGHISAFWLRFWIIIVVLFLLASADNLLLQASDTERKIIAILAALGTICGAFHLVPRWRPVLREPRIVYFILFLTLMEAASLVFNIGGRYNLAKIFMTCGYFGMVLAILFLWTARLINEGLAVASAVYKRPDKHLFFINFERVGGRAPSILYAALIAGWFVLVARNFYMYTRISSPIVSFIREQRTIGEYTFSIQGMLIFLTILACSMFLSRLISFFASDEHRASNTDNNNRLSLGSWLLLVRIIVISSGLFLAVAAAGIPLDRITIIVGALGVGIGLGLQGLVSNLVSGLILAFEKPVNVGDVIEINGAVGTMKSIGFRSSTIVLTNGSVNVVPNSDILNHSLLNWSMGKRQVRSSIVVGVAYGTDLEKVHRLLTGVLAADDHILKDPAPLVVAKAFGESSIDFELYFWVTSLRETFATKSRVLIAVDKALREAGITIPFPQRDVHFFKEEE